MNKNVSRTFTATKLTLGTKRKDMLNYCFATYRDFLLNSDFFIKVCFTKICINYAVTRNISAW